MSDHPRIALLKQHHYGDWLGSGDRAGEIGPYGLEHLQARGFDLDWSDAAASSAAHARGVRRARSLVERRAALRGFTNAVLSGPAVHRSQVVLSLFEDQGTAAATLRSRHVRPYSRVPHVMIACWLAEEFPRLPAAERARVRRSLSSVDRIVVFSSNQLPVLADHLALPDDRISVCPFGIATRFFAHPPAERLPTIDLLAVGQDRSRDYGTFFEALRGTDLQAAVVCSPSSLHGLNPPDNVRVLTGVDHAMYRRLLHAARIVVTPTTAPAYPSGQTVLLEAMAAGKPNIITDSAAIRDYVEPGITALTVPPGDPTALRAAMRSLLLDDARRELMGTAGAQLASRAFDHSVMWGHVAVILHSVLGWSPEAAIK